MAPARNVRRNGRTAARDRPPVALANGPSEARTEVRRTAEIEARTVAATGVKTAVATVPSALISRAGTVATSQAVVAAGRQP